MTSDNRKVRTFVPYGDMMVELPDYSEEPETGSCWNCDHMTEITLGGKSYMLCALERDVSASGDLTECDIDLRDCKDWDEYDL